MPRTSRQVRAKEASEYDAEAEDLQGSIDALEMAIPAIQQGQSGALAQLSARGSSAWLDELLPSRGWEVWESHEIP